MIDTKAKIIFNEKAAPEFFKIGLEAPGIAEEAGPGQFVMVRCSDGTDPLLRRPFSFHKIEKASFELLYKVVGKGTEILSRRRKGEVLDVLGPLGRGFNIDKGPAILIGGGTGIAPLLALAEELKANNVQRTVLLGARTKDHVVCEDEFKKLDAELQVVTEDGSKGCKGLVTDLLRRHCESRPKVGTKRPRAKTRGSAEPFGFGQSLYACGPKPMLKAVSKLASLKKIPCQVSFEERMACGTGACLGCAVETKTGFKMACKDGPVFNAKDIIW